MSMEVTGISFRNTEGPQITTHFFAKESSPVEQQSEHSREVTQSQAKVPPAFVEQQLKELEGLTRFLNRRLKFSFNEELQQVVVKIVDGETDKVIKVLPPEEVQKLHLRIRETLGILFDQLI